MVSFVSFVFISALIFKISFLLLTLGFLISSFSENLNDTIDQLDLIDMYIYRTFHPQTMNFTFFLSTHGTFSRIDHILGHKSSVGKFKKIEIIPSIFSDHNVLRLDVNYRRKTIKNSLPIFKLCCFFLALLLSCMSFLYFWILISYQICGFQIFSLIL